MAHLEVFMTEAEKKAAEALAKKQAEEQAAEAAAIKQADEKAAKVPTKKVRALNLPEGHSFFDPDQSKQKEIGSKAVTVEITARVQLWLEQKQLQEVE